MADVKWIKIMTNVFDDEKIKYIETLPNGDEMIVIWFKILCLAGKSNASGLLMMTDRIAYTNEMLSSIFSRSNKAIQMSLQVFSNLEMIEMIDNRIYLTNWEKHQSLEKLEAKKQYDRLYQKTKREEKLLENRTTIVRQEYDNRSLDIEIEKDIEKDIKTEVKSGRFTPPTLDEVIAYATERNRDDLAQAFYDYYSTGDWKDAKGNKVKNWKQKFITWSNHNNSKSTPKKSGRVELQTEYKTVETSLDDNDIAELSKRFAKLGGI